MPRAPPCIRVFNKCDAYFGILPHGEDVVCLSARTGEGADVLIEKLCKMLDSGKHEVTVEITYSKGAVLDLLQREGAVRSMEYTDSGVTAQICVKDELFGRIKEFIPGYCEPKEDWEDD